MIRVCIVFIKIIHLTIKHKATEFARQIVS